MSDTLSIFLQTGNLCSIKIGMAEDQILASLGLPDAVGGTSRKQRMPAVYLYGCVQVFVSSTAPRVCTMLYIERPISGTSARFSGSCILEGLDELFALSMSELKDYFVSQNLAFQASSIPALTTARLDILPSGVAVTFDEEDKIWSFAVNVTKVVAEVSNL